MARIEQQKARKEYICSKCGNPINKGEMYSLLKMMYQKPKRACYKCGFSRSETTTSDYYATLWDIEDNLQIDSQEDIEELVNNLESLKEELEERLQNMPEQLQYTPNGKLLQERIDEIDCTISELENIEFPDEENAKDELETVESEKQVQEKLSDLKDIVKEDVLEILNNLG